MGNDADGPGPAFNCSVHHVTRPLWHGRDARRRDSTLGAQPQGRAGARAGFKFGRKSVEVAASERLHQAAAGGGGGGGRSYTQYIAPQPDSDDGGGAGEKGKVPPAAAGLVRQRGAEETPTLRAPAVRPPPQWKKVGSSTEAEQAELRRANAAGTVSVVLGQGASALSTFTFKCPTLFLLDEPEYSCTIAVNLRKKFNEQERARRAGEKAPVIVAHAASDGTSPASQRSSSGHAAPLPKALLPRGAAEEFGALPIVNLVLVYAARNNLSPGVQSWHGRLQKVRSMVTVVSILLTHAVTAGEVTAADVASPSLHNMIKVARYICCGSAANRYIRAIYNHYYGKGNGPVSGSPSNASAEDYVRLGRMVTSCVDVALAEALDAADADHVHSYAPPLGGARAAECAYLAAAKRCKALVEKEKGGRAQKQAEWDLSIGVYRGLSWHWATHDASERFFELLNATFRAARAAAAGGAAAAASSSAAAADPAAAAAAAFVKEFPGVANFFSGGEYLRATRELRMISLAPGALLDSDARPNTIRWASLCGVAACMGDMGDSDTVTWNALFHKEELKSLKSGSVNHPLGEHIGQAVEDEKNDCLASGCRNDAPLFTGSCSTEYRRDRITEDQLNVNLARFLGTFLGVLERSSEINVSRVRSELAVVLTVSAMLGAPVRASACRDPNDIYCCTC